VTLWTRARHPEAGEAILTVDGMSLHRAYGWREFGEPDDDRSALEAQIDQERMDAAKQAAAELAAAGHLEGGTAAEIAATAMTQFKHSALSAVDEPLGHRTTPPPKVREITDRPDTARTEGDDQP
jgi:hypothetical protein